MATSSYRQLPIIVLQLIVIVCVIRMDCQLIVHLFTYIHYHAVVVSGAPTAESILAVASVLTVAEQERLIGLLTAQVEGALSLSQG